MTVLQNKIAERAKHTYVNGELVTGKPRELLDRDVVGLGGSSPDDETQRGAAYFTVRICR